MGVYIKGINYAECNKCPLNLMAISETCSLNKKKCPLVEVAEPHGRLIDADRLIRKSKPYHLKNGFDAIPEIDIKHAPTVLEAESEE